MADGDIDRDIIEYCANLGDDVVVNAASSDNGSVSGNTSDSASIDAPVPTHCGMCDVHLGGAAGHNAFPLCNVCCDECLPQVLEARLAHRNMMQPSETISEEEAAVVPGWVSPRRGRQKRRQRQKRWQW